MATEQRLIDANAYPCQTCEVSHCYQNCNKFTKWFESTVDAAEVVRCKACQHWQKRHETRGICLKQNAIVTFTTPDFYCACGERRTDHV